jgi:hypothetical protein
VRPLVAQGQGMPLVHESRISNEVVPGTDEPLALIAVTVTA